MDEDEEGADAGDVVGMGMGVRISGTTIMPLVANNNTLFCFMMMASFFISPQPIRARCIMGFHQNLISGS